MTIKALGWTIATEWSHNGRRVEPGTELSVTGEGGRFRFLRHVTNADGVEWIDVIGGTVSRKGGEARKWRSFRPERVETVHRIAKTPLALAAKRRTSKRATGATGRAPRKVAA